VDTGLALLALEVPAVGVAGQPLRRIDCLLIIMAGRSKINTPGVLKESFWV